MNILHIVAGDLNQGAAKGSLILHKALLKQGINSHLLTNSKINKNNSNIHTMNKTFKDFLKLKLTEKIDFYPTKFFNINNSFFSTGIFGTNIFKTDEYKKADIIHLHWINGGFININILKKINKPIVWTLRDMWAFTGGCHYAIDCHKYISCCEECPLLSDKKIKFDLSKFIFNRKRKYYPKNMNIIAISPWLRDIANKSTLLKDSQINYIWNNIDTNDFFPIKKQNSRNCLGIKTKKKIILVGSTNLDDKYKGFNKFINALKYLDKSEYYLIFFGKSQEKLLDSLGFEFKSFGYLHDILSLRLLYNAADVFVAPSILEAFGKTIAESLACGTPVVCFNSSGPKDMIQHKVDGYLAKIDKKNDLANGIRWVTTNSDYHFLSKKAIEKAQNLFDSNETAKKYIKLYNKLLER